MKLNLIVKNIPELVVTLCATAMVFGNNGINYFFLVCVLLLVLLILTQHRIMGIFIGSITLLLSLFMMLAVFSEFRKFPTVTIEALTLVGVGMSLFVTTLFCAVFMLKKYSNKTTKHNKRTL